MIRNLWRRLVVAVDRWAGRQIDTRTPDSTVINGVRYQVRRGPSGYVSYPQPYDESADEVGGRRDYYDGLGD